MNGIYSGVENLCSADFAAFYKKQYQAEDNKANDNQPVTLPDERTYTCSFILSLLIAEYIPQVYRGRFGRKHRFHRVTVSQIY